MKTGDSGLRKWLPNRPPFGLPKWLPNRAPDGAGPARPGPAWPARPGPARMARPSPARPARPGPATLRPPPPPLGYQKNNGFHGNRSTKPGMAARELVHEAKYRELVGLSNQIITSMRLGSWRPRKMESASREKRKKLFTVYRNICFMF